MLNTLTTSLVETNARERAFSILDIGYEILGPFDRFESPHLTAQNIVPQYDDGMIIVKGTLDEKQAVVISIEGSFQGGGIGEVSGAKLAGTLEKILAECKNGQLIYPIIIYDTGGVRLQEANYGLLSIAEISSAIVELRNYVPVIGIIPGKIGSFGGMSLTAGLCSALIMTREGRLGMNGPEVVEQEAGIRELDAKNKQLIWQMIGGAIRTDIGFADFIVEDDVPNFRQAIKDIWNGKVECKHRVKKYNEFLALFKSLDIVEKIQPHRATDILKTLGNVADKSLFQPHTTVDSRGRSWFNALTNNATSISEIPSVLVAEGELQGKRARFITVVPNPDNKYYRARNGEVGLLEGWALAKYISEVIEEDKSVAGKRLIVPIVDVPSQAFGYHEELFGIYLACSAAVNAYATARIAGHPIVAVLVGNAISGAFLAHGMQANRLIALNDEGVNVHVMSKKSAALITQRTIEELDEFSKDVPSMAYDIQSFHKLGALYQLIDGVNATKPNKEDIIQVIESVHDAYEDIVAKGSTSLANRLHSEIAISSGRQASIKVREMIDEQWK
ncbi:biotin-independent malonate decarboxylase subunit beta [Lysinibacillus agricola]|uniref:Biotin-independent malonate decarboxylase subunit beta n=1 Tax=Lysinibacillus agricola TaxID=2590012 RepID=A0ABX7AVR5_9BACI|nr:MULTISPECIES: biotin-independent malonate decarboxylase subunit beta [Lysinibacillus]KOS62928.1 malonate decarboxylase subunit beta [Lysinibacillus sp. FJAT-14222]QQP13896.1 biotin-independent malonate decarboxylase subunit beta [Lysinibacillus agricola]